VRQRIDKPFILGCLAAIARGAGRPPSRSEFVSLSGIPEHQVTRFFPTWNDAVKASGLQPHTLNERLEDRELLEDWASAVRKNRKPPPRRTYRHLGKFDHRTFERRFGPWSSLPDVFRTFAQGKPEWAAKWADVVALLPAAKPALKRTPHSAANPVQGGASPPVAQALLPVRFSQSSKGGPPQQPSPSSTPPAKLRHPPLHGRPSYGQPMDFRGLRHEPVNE
jgi:hypothetical protein